MGYVMLAVLAYLALRAWRPWQEPEVFMSEKYRSKLRVKDDAAVTLENSLGTSERHPPRKDPAEVHARKGPAPGWRQFIE